MSGKDYSNLNHLALGHIPHEELANKLLQQTRSTEELLSVCRAGHDRILHLVQVGGVSQPQVDEEAYHESVRILRVRAEEAEARAQSSEHNTATLTSNIADLNRRLAEAQAAQTPAVDAGVELATLKAQLAEANAKIEKQETELTTAYMAKSAAEGRANELQSKLDHLAATYDLEDGDDEGTDIPEANLARTESGAAYYKPSRDELREIATARGFRVRPQAGGTEDLNDYVYDAMYEGIKLSHEKS